MEEVLEETGSIKMIYNYISNTDSIFKVNEVHQYDKIVTIIATRNCNCAGKVNTFYVVNGNKIPINRAVKI